MEKWIVNVDEKLNKLSETNHDQNIKLSKVEVTTENTAIAVKRHEELLTKLVEISAVNTESLKYHIKRTDILQNRQYKIVVGLVFLLGMVAVKFGPELSKLLFGLFL